MKRRLAVAALACLALALLAAGAFEAREQRRQDEYVRAVTREALAGVPDDFDAKVTALRDYVRAHVRNVEFARWTRPFLRDTAADTLRTGKGRCGEASRVFVNMARAAGIPAQRLYLEGEKSHVIAVAAREDGSVVVVDSSADPTYFPELQPLSAITAHGEFDTYSTFRRTRALRALPPNYVSLGPVAYFIENPHALLALFCLLASAVLLASALFATRGLPHRRTRVADKAFGAQAAFEG